MKAILLSGLLLCLNGCAALTKDYQRRTCHYEGGYETGVNHAQSGQTMNTEQVTSACEENTKAETSRGYREGYTSIKQAPVININGPGRAMPRCQAQPGKEAHQSFCANLNEFACRAHTTACMFQ